MGGVVDCFPFRESALAYPASSEPLPLRPPLQYGRWPSDRSGAESLPMKKHSAPSWGPQTTAIHAGEPPRHGVGAPVGTPIFRTSTFTFSSTEEMKRWAEGKSKAYIYTRYGNPTLSVAEGKVAALEGAEAAVEIGRASCRERVCQYV